MNGSESQQPANPPQTGRRLGPWGIAALAVLGLLALAALVLLVDPFGWRLLDKVGGLRDEASGAMPAGVALYAEIDLINFSEETLTEFSQPFVAALAEPGVEDLGGGLARLDEMLAAELGLTLRDNVMPWLGRSVGLGLTGMSLAPDGQAESVDWLLVAGTQDRQAADGFLNELARQVEVQSGIAPTQTDYRGQNITSFDLGLDAGLLDSLAFTRSAGQVIIASDEAQVRAAVDAQKGDSLADSAEYQALLAGLPEERGLTLYADQGQAPELSRLLGQMAPLAIGPLDLTQLQLPPGALGVSIVDEGLRIDSTGQGEGAVPQARQMASMFPAEALAYLTGDSLDDVWRSFKSSLAAGGNLADFEESMGLFSREFGFDPDQELLPVLDGEWTLALMPAEEGLLVDQGGVPLGLVLLASGDDPAALEEALAGANQGLEAQRLPLDTIQVAGATATFIDLESLLGGPLPLYGLDGDSLFLGTDSESIAQVLSGGTALADDPGYAAAAGLLPDGYEASAYVDAARLLALLADGSGNQMARLLEPVEAVIFGSAAAGEGVRQGVTIIVVDQ